MCEWCGVVLKQCCSDTHPQATKECCSTNVHKNFCYRGHQHCVVISVLRSCVRRMTKKGGFLKAVHTSFSTDYDAALVCKAFYCLTVTCLCGYATKNVNATKNVGKIRG